jgi:RNA polymerase sigma-70 factor, ECF subfamily
VFAGAGRPAAGNRRLAGSKDVEAVNGSHEGSEARRPVAARTPSPAPVAADDPDREVLARVAAGDVEAFEPLVERHQERIVAVCQRLLGDREAARDAAQEVFLKAFRKAGDFEPRAQVSTWLYRIAVNHCLNLLRRRRLARFVPWSGGGAGGGEEEAPAFDPPDEAADPETALAARLRWQRVRRAIDRLPPGQRAVLVLVRFEGLAYREAAEALGISLGAVESRLMRALRNLDAALAQESGEPGVSSDRRTR